MMLAESLVKAGLPVEGISVLVGPGSTVGMALIQEPRIRKISFTGSLEIGEVITALRSRHDGHGQVLAC